MTSVLERAAHRGQCWGFVERQGGGNTDVHQWYFFTLCPISRTFYPTHQYSHRTSQRQHVNVYNEGENITPVARFRVVDT